MYIFRYFQKHEDQIYIFQSLSGTRRSSVNFCFFFSNFKDTRELIVRSRIMIIFFSPFSTIVNENKERITVDVKERTRTLMLANRV